MYFNSASQAPTVQKTCVTLLSSAKPHERFLQLQQLTEQSRKQFAKVAVLANSEVLTGRGEADNQQVLDFDQQMQVAGVRMLRLAPGCVCCSSKLILHTHLSRLMRLNQPDCLILELDSGAHIAQVLEQLSSPQWDQWFSKVSLFKADK